VESTLTISGLKGRKGIITGHHQERIREMRKDRKKIKSAVSTKRKTDSAAWRDATLNSLTHTQEHIRSLCEAFQAGYITGDEFEQELPTVLNLRDREKRNMNS
jgi:hypothetical protein